MTDNPIANAIFSDLVDKLFNVPIMSNLFRPHYVERLVASGLGDGFKLVSADWSGWDIEHESGTRIEVKQSAARQTWTDRPALAGRPARGSFDIASRRGYWADGGSRWIDQIGRSADLYIFAWHPVVDLVQADHRDPAQWLFFVVPAGELPAGQKSMGRRAIERRWQRVGFHALRATTLAMIAALADEGGQRSTQAEIDASALGHCGATGLGKP